VGLVVDRWALVQVCIRGLRSYNVWVSNPGRGRRNFSSPKTPGQYSGLHTDYATSAPDGLILTSAPVFFPGGQGSRSVKLIAHLHLMPRVRESF
jgi:hypothetical protein